MTVRYLPDRVEVDGLVFKQKFGAASQTEEAVFPEFILVKTQEMLDNYADRFSEAKINDFLELGVLRGGSVAFFNETLKPDRHLAIDIHSAAAEPLAAMSQRALEAGRKLSAKLDISQSDISAIKQAYIDSFGLTPEFDVVIDDASHFYELSLQSFNGIFPMVRSGGVYVIEDWGWAQWESFQDPDNQLFDEPALSNLIHYCVLGCSSGTAGIKRVDITRDSVFVYRNDVPLPADGTYAVQDSFPRRGRSYVSL